ncbi:LOW QUALITY PROTEIN: receptor-like serine/threonine-protein kinase At4g25390 [Rosa rugosa]|uniref:LOW QUALITY PROTEIN: receptor-like serine/threonine-protein kinase At4g25390 n=1 Tax=Rosa rugosa TaxID=74645 RepID=UPI002B40A38D|nr:LOW QUALITY PROTEIN: receptor-like serine/threonine-protein kinase At4g25390 [Rosa rugosa]
MRPITQSPSPSSPKPPQPHRTHLLVPLVGAATTAAFSLLLFLLVCFRKITRKRTAPEADSKPPHRFSYSLLRRATDSFSPTRRLGQGGSGSVFFGRLPHTRQDVAVKLMDSGSLQGEREFQNELFFASMLDSRHVISVLGFSSDRKRRRMLLVYEFMSNGNLQDALLHRKCPELMEWKKRFSIMVDVAKGLCYLHGLDPPVVHGDVKPSNVLLDGSFNVKIADFGLARLKSEIQVVIGEDVKKSEGVVVKKEELEDCGSVVEETESVSVATAGFEDSNLGVDQSPESLVIMLPVSPETRVTASPPEENVDKEGGEKPSVNKDWWMRQENGSGVKDYVMEWIGNEIGNERPTAASSSEMVGRSERKKNKKRNRKRLDWWMSMEESGKVSSKEKRRPAREWWKEEYCKELTKKKKKKDKKQSKGMSFDENESDWWPHDDELYAETRKKKKSRSRSWGSMSSIDWWLDGIRRNASNNSASGEIPKSCGMSSTPSMRGTVCYVAPEYGFGGDPSELCDVYSFGVLLLVVIAGRRPLQVTNSPLSEFQRANLLSWARHLARAGKLIDLVDKSIQGLEQEQALLCITVALVCLQKIPASRPSMKVVVGMLTGELEPPKLPPELTTSAQSRFSHKSHRKVR